METFLPTVQDIDPYDFNIYPYSKNFLGLSSLGPVTIICGQSNSGKSVILNNIFRYKLLHEYPAKDIYFFSKTIRGDLTYKPTLKILSSSGSQINIFPKVDFQIIDKIVKKQEQIGINQMISKDKGSEPVLPKILFIFDDMLSDKGFKHHTSDLSTFSTLCRHYGISMIVLTQKWTAVPDTIRMQSSCSILCSTDNYKKSMIEENAIHGTEKALDREYQLMNG